MSRLGSRQFAKRVSVGTHFTHSQNALYRGLSCAQDRATRQIHGALDAVAMLALISRHDCLASGCAEVRYVDISSSELAIAPSALP